MMNYQKVDILRDRDKLVIAIVPHSMVNIFLKNIDHIVLGTRQ